ncbi:fungal-specific transcription factor domain-containing protein [Biscogniauxia mediterranea]|nr:fungal-specific transcription factor domain-containing protein [Biscogniauxia mediterranea]
MAHSPLSPPCQEPGQVGSAHATNAPTASSTPIAPIPSSSAPYPHIRSCTLCRQRKVKCDRQHPCSGCSRSGSDCVYPPGPGRAAKRSRKTLDNQLLGRLSKLENIIKRLQTQTESQGPEPSHERPGAAAYAETSASPAGGSSRAIQGPRIPQPTEPGPSLTPEPLVTQNLGRLMIDETKSYYIGNILWAELGNEIEELRDMLHESSSEDSEDQLAAATPPGSSLEGDVASSPSSTLLGSDAAILGYRSLAHSLRSFHPPYEQSAELFAVFNEKVLPIVYIFHMPTTTRLFWDAVSALRSGSGSPAEPAPSPLDRDTEALLFAIYYSAAASLEAPSSTLARYRFATEQALARASLLTTQSVTVLQAAVLFLTALRHEDDSRTVWSLTALVFHIAQAMGLHRDGAAFGLRPLETEVRRRLWYNICVLDTRSSDYHGYEPIVHEHGFDTRLPLNVCDADLTPDMREPPPERDGEFTPMTFCRIRGEVMRAGWKLSYVPPSSGGVGGAQAESRSLQERVAVVEELRTTLTEKYLRYCDPTVPFQALSSMVARVVLARMWLVVHFPLGRRAEYANAAIRTDYSPDTNMRDKIFSTAVEILELTSIIHSHRDFSKWCWHSRTYIQWHSVALVLYEICLRPPSPECDRAWEYINIINNSDLAINRKEKKGPLWRPIERLMAKARHVREMQRANPGGYQHNMVLSSAATPLYLPEKGPVASGGNQTSTLIPNGPQELGAEGDSIQGMLDTNFFDPFLESLPDAVQDDLFGTILGYNPEF